MTVMTMMTMFFYFIIDFIVTVVYRYIGIERIPKHTVITAIAVIRADLKGKSIGFGDCKVCWSGQCTATVETPASDTTVLLNE